MELSNLDRIEQQIIEFELYKRAGGAAEQLVQIVLNTPYEDLDTEISKLLHRTVPEAKVVRHLSLDRLSPYKIAKISAELEALRQLYREQE
jgi:hypothetical protein